MTEIFMDCLFKDEELLNGAPAEGQFVSVEGVMIKVGFNLVRLSEHRDEIYTILSNLPKEFISAQNGGGAGWSFLKLCDDRNGNLWTGLH